MTSLSVWLRLRIHGGAEYIVLVRMLALYGRLTLTVAGRPSCA
jgi:hypothetical protein